MTRKTLAATQQDDDEFEPDEVQTEITALQEKMGPQLYVDTPQEDLERQAKDNLRARRRLDDLCDLADIPYQKRERFKEAMDFLFNVAKYRRIDSVEGRHIHSVEIDAAMTIALIKVREAEKAVSALTKDQRFVLGAVLRREMPTWLNIDEEEAARDWYNYRADPDTIVANRVPQVLSALSRIFSLVLDKNPNTKSSAKRRSPEGGPGGYAWRQFVSDLFMLVNENGGRLPFSRVKGSSVVKGRLLDALDLLKPDLPVGLIPAPIPTGILEKIQASVRIKPTPRSQARPRRRGGQRHKSHR